MDVCKVSRVRRNGEWYADMARADGDVGCEDAERGDWGWVTEVGIGMGGGV